MKKDITYLSFGDSITFGHDGITHAHPMENPYPKQVAAALGIETQINRAASGATLAKNDLGLVCMSERILSHTDPADVVSLLIGVNDYQTHLPLGEPTDCDNTTFFGALNLVAEHLCATQKEAFIFFMTPFKAKIKGVMHTECNNAGYPLSKIREAIICVCEKHSIPLLDLYELGGYESVEMMNEKSDGLHPSEQFFTEHTVPQIVAFLKERCSLFKKK